jgi:hypothetical protein
MADVVVPDQFNEQFTLYLNTDGEPVQRTLREMTADEVLAAERWQLAEADRLDRETEPLSKMAEMIEAGVSPPGLTPEGAAAATAELRKAADAAGKYVRLMTIVKSRIGNQWDRHPTLTMREALRRYWRRAA